MLCYCQGERPYLKDRWCQFDGIMVLCHWVSAVVQVRHFSTVTCTGTGDRGEADTIPTDSVPTDAIPTIHSQSINQSIFIVTTGRPSTSLARLGICRNSRN